LILDGFVAVRFVLGSVGSLGDTVGVAFNAAGSGMTPSVTYGEPNSTVWIEKVLSSANLESPSVLVPSKTRFNGGMYTPITKTQFNTYKHVVSVAISRDALVTSTMTVRWAESRPANELEIKAAEEDGHNVLY